MSDDKHRWNCRWDYWSCVTWIFIIIMRISLLYFDGPFVPQLHQQKSFIRWVIECNTCLSVMEKQSDRLGFVIPLTMHSFFSQWMYFIFLPNKIVFVFFFSVSCFGQLLFAQQCLIALPACLFDSKLASIWLLMSILMSFQSSWRVPFIWGSCWRQCDATLDGIWFLFFFFFFSTESNFSS